MKKPNTYPPGRFLIAIALACTMAVSTLGGVLKVEASAILPESTNSVPVESPTSTLPPEAALSPTLSLVSSPTVASVQSSNTSKSRKSSTSPLAAAASVPGAGIYDDTNTGWKYTGAFVVFASSGAYNGGIHYSTTMGNYAEFTFNGSQASVLYTGNTNRGKADVYVDGSKIGTMNQYSAASAFQQRWTSGNLGAGTHTIKLLHVGPAGATINIDAIEVRASAGPTPTPGTSPTRTPTPVPGTSQVYYVSSAGNNADGKSWATAWKGLNQVNWSVIQPGTRIYISGGKTSVTYSGGIQISKSGTASAYITIDTGANSPSPAGNNGTVILEGGNYCIRATGSYLKIRNLLCQHATSSGFRIEGTGTILENNIVRETYGQGIHVHYCTSCIVRGNRVTSFPNDGASENRPYQTDGIVIYDSSDTLIDSNWIKLTNQYGPAHIDGIQASTTLGKKYQNITVQYNYVENDKNMTSNSQGIYLTQMEGNVKIIGNVVNHPNGNQTVVSYLPNNVGTPVNVFVIGNTIKCAGYRCLLVGDDNPTIKNNIIWQTGKNQLVDLRDNTSCNSANINNNLYYAPNSSYPFAGSCGRTWSDWNTGKKLDVKGIFGQNPSLDSCFRPSSALPVGKGAILSSEYGKGLSSALCGTNGPATFLPVTLINRGSAWDIGAYEK